MGQQSNNYLVVILAAILVFNVFLVVEGKRTFGKSRSSSGSSSSSSSSRRVTSNYGSVTKPAYTGSASAGNSHSDLAKLSYSNYNSQPNRASAPAAGAAAPIGWNVPNKPQGPPPAYSPTNPIGGGHSNLHDPPPAYKPSNVGPPSYSSATHTGNTFGASHGAPSYSGVGQQHHTPVQATNMQSVHSSYPKQEYHPGQAPTYHAPNMQSYNPSSYSGAPMYGAALPHGGVALPPGAILLPAGSALPAHATFVSQQPQQSSSGLGFGTGLLSGALGGGLLGYALAPSGSKEVVHQAVPAAAAGNGEKVIIINNGPPGSVTTSEVGGGTTVINTAPGAPAMPMVQGAPPAPVGEGASMAGAGVAAATVAGAGVVAANANSSYTSSNADPSVAVSPAQGATPEPGANNAPPPAGGIVCVPVPVNVTSPTDPTQMVEVQQIACFNAPPPPASDGMATTSATSVPNVPEPVKIPDQHQMPGLNASPTSTAILPENSKIQQAAASANSFSIASLLTSTLLSIVVAYCIH